MVSVSHDPAYITQLEMYIMAEKIYLRDVDVSTGMVSQRYIGMHLSN
jgi:hypothetical protein